jgi:hypothetical protein
MSESGHAFLARLEAENGYSNGKLIRGGTQYATIAPKMYTHAIITGRVGDMFGYGDCWCYPSRAAACRALADWDGEGEPEGWIRHPDTGRRVSQSPDEYDANQRRVGAVGVLYVRP